MAFDQEMADRLVHELGAQIVRSPKFAGLDWVSLAVVFDIDDVGRSVSGYAYLEGDDWTPAVPDADTIKTANELREATRISNGEPWLMCLVTIVRGTGAIEVDFDYDGGRWQPDYADPVGFALGLRP